MLPKIQLPNSTITLKLRVSPSVFPQEKAEGACNKSSVMIPMQRSSCGRPHKLPLSERERAVAWLQLIRGVKFTYFLKDSILFKKSSVMAIDYFLSRVGLFRINIYEHGSKQ